MVEKEYSPEKGDIVWIDFNPQLGHEQKGRRPALVISHKKYNEKVGLALFCPITSKNKPYPFNVSIAQTKIQGTILSDQVKSLDWTCRNIEFIEKIGQSTLEEVIEKILVLIE
jgi:mRNA interferase MazF